MAITINSTRENDNDQTVYFSIDYDGEKSWHGDIPKDADPQEFLDAKEDTLKCEILRKQYRDADVPQLEDKTPLESFEAWIAGGAKNAEITETRVTPAQPAVDVVVGERQKTVESSSPRQSPRRSALRKSRSTNFTTMPVRRLANTKCR